MKNRILIGQFNDEDNTPFLKTMSLEEIANGIIVAGKSNFGKTNTVESIISQMILRYGAYFMIGDYRGGSEKSMTPKLLPLRKAFLADIAIEADEIIALIEGFEKIVDDRLRNIDTDRTPIVLVIDEFISFAKKHKPAKVKTVEKSGNTITTINKETYIDQMETLLYNARRVNMSIVIIGQNFTQQEGLSGLRAMKDAFANKIIHRLEATDAKGFGFDAKMQNVIAQFNAGVAWFDGRVIKVPLVLPELREATIRAVERYEPRNISPANTQDIFLETMIEKYGNRQLTVKTPEDLIRVLKYDAGLSGSAIRQLIRNFPKGSDDINDLYKSV